jgi:RNA polymerase sigma-70 factor (ECF subfamily)
MEQRALVLRAMRGDPDAFDTLVTATIGRLDGAARLILRDPERAKDAVQDAYSKAWRDLPGLRDPERFEAWLRRLVVHSCYDELRRARSRPVQVHAEAIAHPLTADPHETLADRDALERAVRALDVDLRTVVVLFYYLDLPLPEVARSAGIAEGTAKSRLFRARAALRDALGAPADVRPHSPAEGRA